MTRNLRAASDMLRFIWTNWQIAPVKLLALKLSCQLEDGGWIPPSLLLMWSHYGKSWKCLTVPGSWFVSAAWTFNKLAKWTKKKLESIQLSKNPPGVSSAWLVALGRALACVLLWIRRAFLFLRRLRQFCLTGALRWRIRHAYGERLPTVQHSEMPFYCWPWNLWLNMHGACTCDLGSIAYCLPEARESGKTRKKRRLGKTGNLIGIS